MAYSGHSKANLDAMIPEVWSPIVNEKNFPKATIANFVTDLSEYVNAGGDTVHVPDAFTNTFTVQTQSTEASQVSTSTAALVDVTITVNTHKYVAFMIGDKSMKQLASIYNLNGVYAREVQGLLVNALEADLFALWSSLTTTAVGDTASGLSDATIRRAIATLTSADFAKEELAFFFHENAYWLQLHGISKYYTDDTANLNLHVDGNFGNVADTSRGLKGKLFGIPIFTSTRVTNTLQGYMNMLLHPRAFGFAILNDGVVDTEVGASPVRIRIQSQYELDYLAQLTVGDMMYGTGLMRGDAGVVVRSDNSFVVS